jgi:hypothetical protein
VNKAFIKENDGADQGFCPRCGQQGVPVEEAPLTTYLTPEARKILGRSAYWCDHPDCTVAYFDNFDAAVSTTELKHPVAPKDPTAPLCACFGLTYDDVRQDVDDGFPSRIRALHQRSNTDEARCRENAPSGRCCLTAVQKLYFQLRGGAGTD